MSIERRAIARSNIRIVTRLRYLAQAFPVRRILCSRVGHESLESTGHPDLDHSHRNRIHRGKSDRGPNGKNEKHNNWVQTPHFPACDAAIECCKGISTDYVQICKRRVGRGPEREQATVHSILSHRQRTTSTGQSTRSSRRIVVTGRRDERRSTHCQSCLPSSNSASLCPTPRRIPTYSSSSSLAQARSHRRLRSDQRSRVTAAPLSRREGPARAAVKTRRLPNNRVRQPRARLPGGRRHVKPRTIQLIDIKANVKHGRRGQRKVNHRFALHQRVQFAVILLGWSLICPLLAVSAAFSATGIV